MICLLGIYLHMVSGPGLGSRVNSALCNNNSVHSICWQQPWFTRLRYFPASTVMFYSGSITSLIAHWRLEISCLKFVFTFILEGCIGIFLARSYLLFTSELVDLNSYHITCCIVTIVCLNK